MPSLPSPPWIVSSPPAPAGPTVVVSPATRSSAPRPKIRSLPVATFTVPAASPKTSSSALLRAIRVSLPPVPTIVATLVPSRWCSVAGEEDVDAEGERVGEGHEPHRIVAERGQHGVGAPLDGDLEVARLETLEHERVLTLAEVE